jgi:5-methylcytosine-specific restriction protein A
VNFKESIDHLIENYLVEKTKDFTGNALANHLRNVIPDNVTKALGENDRYYVKGSAGQSGWANVPWISVLDRTVTTSPQNGFYLVYLLREDGAGVYLSLNQGVTNLKEKYGKSVSDVLRVRASDFNAQLKFQHKGSIEGPIDLASSKKGSLGDLYQHGAIYSIYYEKGKIPDDSQLEYDLLAFVDLYLKMVVNQSVSDGSNVEEDEAGLDVEDGTKLREHKRIERNQTLAKKVKKLQGYKCSACGFDFEKKYGEIGKGFIEAHHLTPVYKIKGKKVALDPIKDFSVLCSNCHRMIHKTQFVDRVEEFKAQYVIG